jgi:Family of unknown function (DUF5724)/Domain of unknown function (DUF4132)
MEITELLKPNEVSDPIKKFTDELLKVYQSANPLGKIANSIGKISGFEDKNNKLLTKRTAEIGLLLLNALPEMKAEKNRWSVIEYIAVNDERYKRLIKLIPDNGWKSDELKNLLVFFFGTEKAVYVSAAWDKIRFQMYQNGYARRSFRAPNNRDLYFINQLNFLIGTIPQVYSWENYSSNKRKFYDLSVTEQIKYSQYFQQNSLFRLWSAAIDAGGEEAFRQLEDIIFNKDEVGKVTREIIKALLNSEKKEAWQLVEKLLLAAQRQEGLRQTILEGLDETSVGGLKYMINVIISNKLARFSSVVRAIDVWAGLGWESEREKTVNLFLEKAHEYLENPDKIPEAVKSANNMDVYMALWAQGIFDVEENAPFLHELYEKGNAEKRALALKFAFEAKNDKLNMPLYYKALGDTDLMVLAWALNGIKDLTNLSATVYRNNPNFPELFEKLHSILKRTEIKEKSFEGKIFSWMRIVFSKNDALSVMIDLIGEDQNRLDTVLNYFEQMSVNLREKLTRHILENYAGYAWEKEKKTKPPTDFQRNFAFRLLSDRGEFMVRAAFNALQKVSFSNEEIENLQTLLKRKGADFRGKIIALLLKQPDEKLADAAAKLLASGDGEQCLAGLDILLQLKKSDRLKNETAKLVENFKERKSVSPKEEILLSQLSGSHENGQDFSVENGYGIFDVGKSVSPILAPQIDSENIYEKRLSKHEYGFSVPFKKVKTALEKLGEIYLQNKDFEYEVENYNNTKETVLLGNAFRNRKYNHKFATKREEFENYPLFEVWEKWFQDSGLDAGDLEVINLSSQPKVKNLVPFYGDLQPQEFTSFYYYNNPMFQIVNALRGVFPFQEKNEFMLGGSTRLFASLEKSTLEAKPKEGQYYYGNSGNGWQGNNMYHSFYNSINFIDLEDRFVEKLWNLAHWRQFSGRAENINFSFPSLSVFCRAFELGIISEDELMRGLMTADNIRTLSAKIVREKEFDYFKRFSFLKLLFEKIREHILDIELKRGDSPTSVTKLTASLQTIYGAKRFAEILSGLGKTPLNRGYYYYYGNEEINKQRSFSRLLKVCSPLETDTQGEFDALVKQSKISETKLIEAAVYAPQWQKFVSRYLNWKGLDSAVWWMHAHTKIAGYREQNSEAESEIAKYSAVDLQDFKDGAVDKDWFLSAFKQIGKVRWEIIYDAAKYISDGNGHRRARLYADVISGKTKLKEIVEKVKNKRDQDYLRVYGLVPLSKTNAEKDVLARYAYLQKFKKESRQFGAQKQTSEALAIRIALENLARNAGFADPVRLTWAMETKQVQAILSAETEVKSEDTIVKLVIDEEGKADVITFKGEKMLKSIPPKLKKDKAIIELNEHKKTLREQFSRSRKGLEEAMIRGDEFEFAELGNLFAHPVISKHLKKLVFISGENHGFYKDGKFVSAKENELLLSENDKIRIAHCVDLYESGEWSDYQRLCFDHELKQPFKQIFRELYTPTEDELKEKSISRRYAGHQIQPKQTLALLKTRGWKADYEEGLQKVFHKEGFTAKMYAMADWFSPAEVESPTLETVEFHNLKDYKNIAFEEINARIFSEVMRDIDLVVSVAHAGGVDAEASHSSIEMRGVLLKETLRLFRLENVEIAGNHAKIKGSLGEYSVHLGSAVVHKLPGKYLSILPVHSQQRGRIFLPFADDDPKSAELISKVLLLARDKEIQDPTILRQLS